MAPSAFDRIFESAAPKQSPSKDQSPINQDGGEIKELPGGYKKLPNGVILDKEGKPCRSCTANSAWMAMMKKSTKPAAATVALASNTTEAAATPPDCPPDVEVLGRSTWTMLHNMAATYPESAPSSMQTVMKQFISTFSKLYPCGWCAEDFREWMKEPGNEPRVRGQDELGMWMCEAHNAVNTKLGKPAFECSLWKQRWKDGWKDGRCG